MKKNILLGVVLLFTFIIISGCVPVAEQQVEEDHEVGLDCKNVDVTVDYLKDLAREDEELGDATEEELDAIITQEYVDKFNSLPYCIDVCKEQLQYSKEYEDWWADEDMREVCSDVGIVLPK